MMMPEYPSKTGIKGTTQNLPLWLNIQIQVCVYTCYVRKTYTCVYYFLAILDIQIKVCIFLLIRYTDTGVHIITILD